MDFDIRIREFENGVKKRVKQMEEAGQILVNVHAKLQHLKLKGYVYAETIWDWAVVIRLEREDMTVDYTCGVVAEIERALNMESEFLLIPDEVFEKLKYVGIYEKHEIEIICFPKNSCIWVETGEERIIKEKKLICD